MTYRDPFDFPNPPRPLWRVALAWFIGIGGGAAGLALVLLVALMCRDCARSPSDLQLVNVSARAYVRELWREAQWTGVVCAARDTTNGNASYWQCDVFIRWLDRSEFRRLECRPHDGCLEQSALRRPTVPGEPGHR